MHRSLALVLVLVGCRTSSTPGEGSGGPADAVIAFYQDHLGPQWGGHCDFEPSCSAFGREAIGRYGFWPGLLMTGDRLQRDHPFSIGFYSLTADGQPFDPVARSALFEAATVATHWPATQEAEDGEDRRPPAAGEEEQFDFAEELFAAGEWERAWIEYRRSLHHFPQGRHALRCRERLVVCLSQLGRHGEARAQADSLPPGPARELLEALAIRAREGSEAAWERAAGSGTDEGRLLAGMLAWEADRPEQARRLFVELPEEARSILLERGDAFEDLPRRSPTLGGTMSAVLPGSGQAYAGRWGDGAMALLINGLFLGGAAVAIHNEEYVTAGALGAVGLGFYGGNVYGGARAARDFNRAEQERFLDRTRGLLRERRSGLGIQFLEDGGAVGWYLRF